MAVARSRGQGNGRSRRIRARGVPGGGDKGSGRPGGPRAGVGRGGGKKPDGGAGGAAPAGTAAAHWPQRTVRPATWCHRHYPASYLGTGRFGPGTSIGK